MPTVILSKVKPGESTVNRLIAVIVLPDARILLRVRPGHTGEIQKKAVFFSLNIDTRVNNIDFEFFPCVTRLNKDVKLALIIEPISEVLFPTADIHFAYKLIVHENLNIRVVAVLIVDKERNDKS